MTESLTKQAWGSLWNCHADRVEQFLYVVESEAARGVNSAGIWMEARHHRARLDIQVTDERIQQAIVVGAKRAPRKKATGRAVDDEGGRDVINLDSELDWVVNQSIWALAKLGTVYQRQGRLVDYVTAAEPDGKRGLPEIRRMPRAAVREELGKAAQFVRTIDGQVRRVDTPWDVVDTLMARGEWADIPALSGVVAWPTLRPDHSILQAQGYDTKTGLYCARTFAAKVPEEPTRAEAEAALELLKDVFSEFPFARPESLSACLAALLSIPARPAIDGPVPMMLVQANTWGTGKGLLVNAIAIVATGKEMPTSMAPKNEEEWDKRLSTWTLAGLQLMSLDNIKVVLASEALELALTAREYSSRILGKTEDGNLRVPWTMILFGTGNNLQIGADMVRRTVVTDLETQLERPEQRTDIKRKNLLAYCHENRERLLVAALTILRAYHVAGREKVEMRPMGSFEAWSAEVCAPLIWLGMADPIVSQDELRESADTDRDALELLFEAWGAEFGESPVTVGEMLANTAMSQAVEGFARPRAGEAVTARLLGGRLKKAKKQIVAGRQLVTDGKGATGQRWRMVRVGGQPQHEVGQHDP